MTATTIRNVELPMMQAHYEVLESLAADAGKSAIDFLSKSVVQLLEDLEDIREAEAVIAEGGPTYTLEEVMREFGYEF